MKEHRGWAGVIVQTPSVLALADLDRRAIDLGLTMESVTIGLGFGTRNLSVTMSCGVGRGPSELQLGVRISW